MNRRGFTVVEMLVVVTVVLLVLGVIMPAIERGRESSRAAICKEHLKQLATGVDLHLNAHNRYPPGQFLGRYGKGQDSTAWGWLARTLPFVGQADLYKAGGIPTNSLEQSGVAGREIEMFRCPSDKFSGPGPGTARAGLRGFPTGLTNYKAVTGANWGVDESTNTADIGTDWRNPGTNGSFDGQDHGDGIMYRSDVGSPRRRADITDGVGHTFMLGEDIPDKDTYCSWPYSNNNYSTCAIPPNVVPKPGSDYSSEWWPNVLSFRSGHPGGVYFALADERVVFVTSAIDLSLYRALATIRGNEPVDVSQFEE